MRIPLGFAAQILPNLVSEQLNNWGKHSKPVASYNVFAPKRRCRAGDGRRKFSPFRCGWFWRHWARRACASAEGRVPKCKSDMPEATPATVVFWLDLTAKAIQPQNNAISEVIKRSCQFSGFFFGWITETQLPSNAVKTAWNVSFPGFDFGIRFAVFPLFAKALDELWSQESVDELLAQADVSGDGQLQFEERGLGWRGMDHWKRMKKVDIYLQKKGHRWWERTCVKVECISIMLRWCLIATHVTPLRVLDIWKFPPRQITVRTGFSWQGEHIPPLPTARSLCPGFLPMTPPFWELLMMTLLWSSQDVVVIGWMANMSGRRGDQCSIKQTAKTSCSTGNGLSHRGGRFSGERRNAIIAICAASAPHMCREMPNGWCGKKIPRAGPS